jgi:hypothetical protein
MSEENKKDMTALAEQMLTESDPFKAACSLFGNDITKALFAAQNWPKDPAFIKIQHELKQLKGKESLPTKVDLAQAVWDKMQSRYIDGDEFAKLAKLYAEINGYIEKTPTVAINNNLTTNKVMVVPKFQNSNVWEESAVIQQKQLTDNAATRH